jgi:excisionase family DNA binding protein
MSGSQVSVSEAAEMLGVHPQRVHQRIRDGSLPAEKIGNQWVVEVSDVRRLSHHAGPGRPLSSKSAWDLLALAASGQVAAALSPSSRSRARMRLRSLLVLRASDDPDAAAAVLTRALGNRAARSLFVSSPRDLADASADERLSLSGVSLPESNMSVATVVEGYVYVEQLEGLVEDHLLSPAPPSRANVILHVAPSATTHPVLVDLDALARSPLAIAADLAEHDGIRERNEALRALADLRARF